ncbi:hypothetical protein LSAT2_025806, partial [Lamellibrachia satsuma]
QAQKRRKWNRTTVVSIDSRALYSRFVRPKCRSGDVAIVVPRHPIEARALSQLLFTMLNCTKVQVSIEQHLLAFGANRCPYDRLACVKQYF